MPRELPRASGGKARSEHRRGGRLHLSRVVDFHAKASSASRLAAVVEPMSTLRSGFHWPRGEQHRRDDVLAVVHVSRHTSDPHQDARGNRQTDQHNREDQRQ